MVGYLLRERLRNMDIAPNPDPDPANARSTATVQHNAIFTMCSGMGFPLLTLVPTGLVLKTDLVVKQKALFVTCYPENSRRR